MLQRFRPLLCGLVWVAAAVALAFLITRWLTALSPLTVAVVLGVIVGNTGLDLRAGRLGLSFAAKKFLRAGIVLLGLRLAMSEVLSLGLRGVATVIGIVAVTFVGTQLLARWMGLSRGTGLLVATGFSICGASAIAAMDGVTHNKEDEVVTAIALVTMCGSLAIAVLPILQGPLGLTDARFGIWSGASVHDVAQVIATASVAGPAALAPAVIVKLTRVILLAPIVTAASLWERRRSTTADAVRKPPIIPLFVVGFLAMVALRSTGVVPPSVLSVAQTLESILLAAALFGLGTTVNVKTLFTTGAKASLLGLTSWLGIAALSFAAVPLIAG